MLHKSSFVYEMILCHNVCKQCESWCVFYQMIEFPLSKELLEIVSNIIMMMILVKLRLER